MRQNEAGSMWATCLKISMRTSVGILEIGHGGGGVFSIRGSACGIGKLAKERINSGVDNGSSFSSSFGAVGTSLTVLAEGAGIFGAGAFEAKCFFRYV
jgi:hypothetical protein